ncbi:MAG: adenylate/guanylate cyclase domain-containing protein [Patulibacter sp.]
MARAVAIGVIVGLLAAGLGATVLAGPERDLADVRFRVVGGMPPASDVAVVAIDQDAYEHLGFPFRRRLHADVIRALLDAGARRVVYDVQFGEPSSSPADDRALLRAAADRRVILGASETFTDGEPDVLGGANRLRRSGGAVGQVLFPLDDDGVWRRFDGRVFGVPHVAVLAAGGSPDVRERWIAFAGPPGTVPELPFLDVLDGRFDRAAVRDRIVVVGVTAPAGQDLHPTSIGGGQMSGPEIVAHSVQTVLADYPLRDGSPLLRWALLLLAGLVAPLASALVRPARRLTVAIVAGAIAATLLVAGSFLLFRSGVMTPLAAPLVAAGLGSATAAALAYRHEVRGRRRLRRTFERFVAPDVAGELLRDQEGDDVALPSRTLPATMVFCDLRGFTSLADTADPERVVVLLNRYLAMVSDAVLEHGGTVVSFQGDGVLAAFGVPVPSDDHATRAWRAVRAIVDRGLRELNRWAAQHGHVGAEGLRVGIGMHTGLVVSGLVGSERRVEYAAVGATTNVAARLQALGREHPGRVFLSRETAAAITDPLPPLRTLGPVTLRGRAVPIEVLVEDGTPSVPVAEGDAKLEKPDQDFGVQIT